jgi:putative peptidoglycan lipid II flippase
LTILAKAVCYWRGLATGSVNRRIFSALVVITAATAAVKLAAVGKDVIVVGTFGLSDALDAFLIALAIPSFLSGLIGYSFVGAFVPIYVRVREREGQQASRRLFSHVIVINFAILAGLALMLGIVGVPLLKLLAWEFSAEKLALAHQLYLLLLCSAVLDGQVLLWGSVLNAGEKFALAALTPIFSPLLMVTALLVFPGLDIYALVWGALVAAVVELVILGFALKQRDLLPRPRWNRANPATAQILGQCGPLVLGSLFASSALVIDQAMASWLGAGSVSALNYGNKIPAFLCGLGVTALGTAVLPHFSRLVASGDYRSIRDTLQTYTRWILVLAIPFTLLCMAGSEWLVKVLFERGAFSSADTALVAFIQQMYFIQVPFSVVTILGARLLVAMTKNHHLWVISAICLVLNVAGNLLLMRWLGVSGIALATSIASVASMSMVFAVIHVILRGAQVARPA